MVGVVRGLNAQANNENYRKSPSLAHVLSGTGAFFAITLSG